MYIHWNYRSSHPEVFSRKCVRNFTNFTGKHLCQSLFFNKVGGLAWNCIKKETLVQVLSYEFCEIFKNTFFTEHLWWLLLKLNIYTLAAISFKLFAFSKLNVTCNYKKSLVFNGSLRQTRYDFLTKKLRHFLFLVCCNCPKVCLKLEANKTQTFIASRFSSLCRGHYVKSKRKFYANTLLESLWMKKAIIYNFWLQSDKDSVFNIKRTQRVLCFISKRNIECFVKYSARCIVINYSQQNSLFVNFAFFFINSTGGVL